MVATNQQIKNLLIQASREIDNGNNAAAVLFSQKILEIDPGNLEAQKYLGNAFINLRKYENALLVFGTILQSTPDDAIALWAMSYSLYQLKRLPEVFPYINRCIATGMQLRGAYTLLGTYYLEYERNSTKAIQCFETEIGLDPRSEKAFSLLANAYASRGEIDKSIAYIKKQLEINPKNEIANNNLIMYSHYSPNCNSQLLIDTAQQVYKNIYQSYANNLKLDNAYSHLDLNPNKDKLRIGFVSGDFKKHAIFYWLRGLFKHIHNDDFTVYCYCNNREDEATELWKQEIEHWRNIRELSDEQVLELVREDQIDVLIDLSGHTALNRLRVFINKPSPLQMTWLGQAGPLGIPQIDYMISDSYLVRVDEEKQYTEKISRLNECFAPFSIPQHDIKITDAPCLSLGHVTFACFNNYMKVNSTVLDAWTRILKSVNNSRLILKARVFLDQEFCKEVLAYFADAGIDESRVSLTQHNRNRLEYIQAYNSVDIALDPFPVGGGTTTHDTLWMATPLITLYGSHMSHRTSADLLHNIGHDELIAYDIDEYCSKAIELTDDFDRIRNYKSNLRAEYLNSPMCDLDRFAESFRLAIKRAWAEKLSNPY